MPRGAALRQRILNDWPPRVPPPATPRAAQPAPPFAILTLSLFLLPPWLQLPTTCL